MRRVATSASGHETIYSAYFSNYLASRVKEKRIRVRIEIKKEPKYLTLKYFPRNLQMQQMLQRKVLMEIISMVPFLKLLHSFVKITGLDRFGVLI